MFDPQRVKDLKLPSHISVEHQLRRDIERVRGSLRSLLKREFMKADGAALLTRIQMDELLRLSDGEEAPLPADQKRRLLRIRRLAEMAWGGSAARGSPVEVTEEDRR